MTAKSNYITPEGAEKLRQEARYLWKVKRPEVTKAVSEAAALGDRSENAEYIYGKKQLREIDRRLFYLSKRLDQLKVVNDLPKNQEKIYFGAWVSLEDDEGQQAMYRIVGPDELDPGNGLISIDAPLARLMLGKQVDDEFDFATQSECKTYTIVAIRYTPPD